MSYNNKYLKPMEVEVSNDNVMGAYRKLTKKMGQEGHIFEIRRREFFRKPSLKRREKRIRAARRRRREERMGDTEEY